MNAQVDHTFLRRLDLDGSNKIVMDSGPKSDPSHPNSVLSRQHQNITMLATTTGTNAKKSQPRGRASKRESKMTNSSSLFLLFLVFSSISLSISAKVPPSIQEPSKPISRINLFDTSNYGKLQLNNGVARTPQMGSVSSLHFLGFWLNFIVK